MFRARHRFKACTGAHYLGGYIGDNKYKRDWLRESKMTWENNINTISKTAGNHPQESYAAVVRTIQLEWIFLQHVTWFTIDAFAGVERMIWETFLPRLFFRNMKTLSTIVGDLSMMLVKKSRLGTLNPVASAQDK